MGKRLLSMGGLLACAAAVLAQNGDKAGETQAERVPAHLIPPAPVLSPVDQIGTFRLPEGFRAEVVAAEPLIATPVAAQFDHQGRLWVVEMTGYMRHVDGSGETEPNGSIVILKDTDGDGRMDQRTVFLGGLVMPRSVMLFREGALVAEPPRLWYARDTDGDGQCDSKELVADDYATQNDPKLGAKSNPEHASNSPTWALDNWIYSANHTTRFRWRGGTNWQRGVTIFRGQWGLSQDDLGRLFYNSNSDPLRADFVPTSYLERNPNLRQPYGGNVQIERDMKVNTLRVNPGVNRGYQPNQLTADGKLATFTGACGPVVYRGDQFPDAYRGDAFLCEPTGNFVRREKLTEKDGVITGANAHPGTEFLASLDERFRPVNMMNGPDGCLYVVDMARGLIQHRIYLTSYLRKQIESRQLQAPNDQGRIYRIVHTSKARRVETLPAKPAEDVLLAKLDHPNGWWRDRAQQLLVESRNAALAPRLREMVKATKTVGARGRLHALWTLEGLEQVDLATLEAATEDPSPEVRAAGLRLIDGQLRGTQREQAMLLLMRRAGFLSGSEQLQLLFTLTTAATPQADTVLRVLLMNGPGSTLRQDAAISGLGGRELEFLEGLLSDPICGPEKKEHASLVKRLAQCVAIEANPARVDRLLEVASLRKTGDWQQLALLDGLASTVPAAVKGRPAPAVKPVRFASQPKGWEALQRIELSEIRERLERVAPMIAWVGDGKTPIETKVRELSESEEASFKRGKELYMVVCGACHQPHGNGQEGLAPPLKESEWVLGSEARMVRMVLHGVRDAITVKGQKWELNMPAFNEALEDQQIADSLTYVRREWGNTAAPVSVETVKRIRAETAGREDSWTEAELLKVP
jgi:mono/diheme cytochrome c family protein/glucose/arabinose dehydrogenase